MFNYLMISVLIFAYFVYMTAEDVKTMTVPVLPSNILIITLSIAYPVFCLIYKKPIDIVTFLIGTAILVFFLMGRRFMGSADAKALYICFLASPFFSVSGFSGSFDPFVPATVYFLSAIPFIIYRFVVGVKHKEPVKQIFKGSKTRVAFFPFLFVGYVEMSVLFLKSLFFIYTSRL